MFPASRDEAPSVSQFSSDDDDDDEDDRHDYPSFKADLAESVFAELEETPPPSMRAGQQNSKQSLPLREYKQQMRKAPAPVKTESKMATKRAPNFGSVGESKAKSYSTEGRSKAKSKTSNTRKSNYSNTSLKSKRRTSWDSVPVEEDEVDVAQLIEAAAQHNQHQLLVRLPAELLAHVLVYLDYASLARLSAVESTIRSFAGSRRVWERMFVEPVVGAWVDKPGFSDKLSHTQRIKGCLSQENWARLPTGKFAVSTSSVAPLPQAASAPKKKGGLRRFFGGKSSKQPTGAGLPLRLNYNIVTLGDGGVGAKSALIIQFKDNVFIEEYDPTIENLFTIRKMYQGREVTFDILDTAGQEDYAAMRGQYINKGEAFLLGYSITSRSSFSSMQTFRDQVLLTKDSLQEEIPMVLVGNKCDLESHREVSYAEGERLARMWGIPFFETSAKLRTNIDECIFTLANETDMKIDGLASQQPISTIMTTGNSTYVGQVDSDGLPHGRGTCVYSLEDNPLVHQYAGGWTRGRKHGIGVVDVRLEAGSQAEDAQRGTWNKGVLVAW